MKILDLTVEQEAVLSRTTAFPEVHIWVYVSRAGEWKMWGGVSALHFAEHDMAYWEKQVVAIYPSAILIRVCRVKP